MRKRFLPFLLLSVFLVFMVSNVLAAAIVKSGSISPSNGEQGDQFTFTCDFFDPGSGIFIVDVRVRYRLIGTSGWFSDRVLDWSGSGLSFNKTISVSNNSGTYEVECWGKEANPTPSNIISVGQRQRIGTFVINSNQPPTLQSSLATPNPILVGDSITLESRWDDPENKFVVDVQVRYRRQGTSSWQTQTLNHVSGYRFRNSYSINTAGTYEYQFRASDANTASGARTNTTSWIPRGTFTVNAPAVNQPPTLQSSSATPNPILVDDSIILESIWDDPENKFVVDVQVRFRRQGTSSWQTQTLNHVSGYRFRNSFSINTAGTYEYQFRASDANTASGARTNTTSWIPRGTFTVNAPAVNQPPTLQSSSATPNPILVDDSIILESIWDDPENKFVVDVKVRYRRQGTSTWQEQVLDHVSGYVFRKSQQINTAGTYEYEFQARDADTASGARTNPAVWKTGGTFTVNAPVANQPPTLQSFSATPNPITTGDSITLESIWDDPENKFVVDVKVRYRRQGTSTWQEQVLDHVSGYVFRKSQQINTAGTYEYEFQARDADTASGARTNPAVWKTGGTFTVNAPAVNQPPTLQSSSATPNPILVDDSIILESIWDDPENKFVVDVKVRYRRQGTSTWQEQVLDHVSGYVFRKSQQINTAGTYEYEFQARDADTASGPRTNPAVWKTGGTFTVNAPAVNQPPTLQTGSATPNPATIGNNISFKSTWEDPETQSIVDVRVRYRLQGSSTWTEVSLEHVVGSVYDFQNTNSAVTINTAGVYEYQFRASDSNAGTAINTTNWIANGTFEVKTVVVNPVPQAPNLPTATTTGTDSISISWNSVSNAQNYALFRAESASGAYTQIYCAAGTTYVDNKQGTGLTPDTTYDYKVRASNRNDNCGTGASGDPDGWSAFSPVASAKTDAIPPQAVDCARFVADITIPDGSRIKVGETFTKTWRIKNCGTTTWNNYNLVYAGWHLNLGTVSSVAIANGIVPNQTVDISVPMQAPNAVGRKKSYWKVQKASGELFDTYVFADIYAYTDPVVAVTPINTGTSQSNDVANQTANTDLVCTAGNPIDMATGAQVFDLSLLSVVGVRPITFTIHYNSLVLSSSTLGTGWSHNHEATLKESSSDGNVLISWSSNQENVFEVQPDGSYTAPHHANAFDQLVKQTDGSFTLTRRDQSQYQFNADGQITQHSNPKGQVLDYSHNEQGFVSKVTEPISGLFLELNYNASNLLESINDPIGRKVEFIQNSAKQLTGYIDAEGNTTTYTLNEIGQRVSATNQEGIEFFHNTYDDEGRITYQKRGRDLTNDQFLLDYSGDAGDPIYSVMAKNKLGDQRTIVYQEEYQVKEIINELGDTTTFEYNSNGLPIKITDAKGRIVQQTFDDNGNLKSVTDPAGNTGSMTYDDHNNLLTQTDPEGNKTTFTYNDQNNVLTQTDARGKVTTYTYNANAQPETITSPEGRIIRFGYAQGLLTTTTNPDGFKITYQHDGAGRVRQITDGDGFTTTLILDDLSRVLSTTDAEGNTRSQTYDSRSNVLTETDANGNVTLHKYDENNNRIQTTDAVGNITKFKYDNEDRLIEITDPKGGISTTGYDPKGRIKFTTNAEGNSTVSEYDKVDNLIVSKDPLNHQTIYTYDNRDNLEKIIDALNFESRFEFDKNNNRIEAIDELKRKTLSRYDALNRLFESVDAKGGVSQQVYTDDGDMESFSDPNQNATTFKYNGRNLKTEEKTAAGSLMRYAYNGRNLVTNIINARNQEQVLEYDKAGRVIKTTDPVGRIEFGYDKNDNLLTVTDSNGTITRTYDAINRVKSYTNTAGETIGYEYDNNSNLSALIYPDGKRVEYTFDKANRLIKVTDWAGRVTMYDYYPNSLLKSTTRPNGSVETRLYNAINQLTEKKDITASAELIHQVNYKYDAVGNILEETTLPLPIVNLPATVSMNYAAGNRINTFDGKTFDFDTDGNILQAPINGTPTDFSYNARNQLTEVLGETYTYDAEGYRTHTEIVSGSPTRYTIHPETDLSQVLIAHQGAEKTWYIYGLGLIGQEINSQYHSYHYDYRGSTVALTDSLGAVSDRFSYSPYAGLANHTGSTVTPFQYNGRDGVMVEANGLYYMRARFYSPELHRFLNRDVLLGSIGNGASLNRFGYVVGNPIGRIDPTGNTPAAALLPFFIGGSGTGAGAGAGSSFFAYCAAVLAGVGIGSGINHLTDSGAEDNAVISSSSSVGATGAGGPNCNPFTDKNCLKNNTNDKKPNSSNSRGRSEPANLQEKLAMEQVKANPGGSKLPIKLNDYRWPAHLGWVKKQQIVNTSTGRVVIHYVKNIRTGKVADFKFIGP